MSLAAGTTLANAAVFDIQNERTQTYHAMQYNEGILLILVIA